MCIDYFRSCRRTAYNERCLRSASLTNTCFATLGGGTFIADLNLCVCNTCPVFKELWLSLGATPHVDTFGEIFVGNTTLSSCLQTVTRYRWLPLVCSNVVYDGLGVSEAHLVLPLTSYPEVFSRLMSVNWDEFSSCLKGKMEGFKRFYSFRRTGKLIYVYNKTCWAYGLPYYKRSTCINKYEKAELASVIADILRETDAMDVSEAAELTRVLNQIPSGGTDGLFIKGLPEVVEEDKTTFIDDMTERLEMLDKFDACVKREEDLFEKLSEEHSNVRASFPERRLSVHRNAVDRLKKAEGRSIGMMSDGVIFESQENTFKHAGEPAVRVIKLKNSTRKSVKYPNKHQCESLEKLKALYLDYSKSSRQHRPSPPPAEHDWEKMEAVVVPNIEAARLKNLPDSTISLSAVALKETNFKVFPISEFYSFLRNLLQEEVFLSKYSSYLRVGEGLDVYQCRTFRSETMFSDKIAREIFWKDFNRKYNKPENLQKIMRDFADIQNSVDEDALQRQLIRFFNLLKRKIKSRKKRWELEGYPTEVKAKLAHLLATYSPAMFSFRKECGVRSSMLRCLIQARVRLVKPS
jgi:hypothetical protein